MHIYYIYIHIDTCIHMLTHKYTHTHTQRSFDPDLLDFSSEKSYDASEKSVDFESADNARRQSYSSDSDRHQNGLNGSVTGSSRKNGMSQKSLDFEDAGGGAASEKSLDFENNNEAGSQSEKSLDFERGSHRAGDASFDVEADRVRDVCMCVCVCVFSA